MKRGGDARSYAAMIDRARQAVPGITIRTTMIVGFPGEGEAEFRELLEFIAAVRFDHVGVFCYSWQPENPGAELGDPVPQGVKDSRRSQILELQQTVALEHNQGLVGKTLPALVVGPLPEMEILTEARLQRQAPEIDGRLLINDGVAARNAVVEVEITEAHPYDLVGRVVRVLPSPSPATTLSLPVLP
jgi:ribosomal protein S12 methylthiotransferase